MTCWQIQTKYYDINGRSMRGNLKVYSHTIMNSKICTLLFTIVWPELYSNITKKKKKIARWQNNEQGVILNKEKHNCSMKQQSCYFKAGEFMIIYSRVSWKSMHVFYLCSSHLCFNHAGLFSKLFLLFFNFRTVNNIFLKTKSQSIFNL